MTLSDALNHTLFCDIADGWLGLAWLSLVLGLAWLACLLFFFFFLALSWLGLVLCLAACSSYSSSSWLGWLVGVTVYVVWLAGLRLQSQPTSNHSGHNHDHMPNSARTVHTEENIWCLACGVKAPVATNTQPQQAQPRPHAQLRPHDHMPNSARTLHREENESPEKRLAARRNNVFVLLLYIIKRESYRTRSKRARARRRDKLTSKCICDNHMYLITKRVWGSHSALRNRVFIRRCGDRTMVRGRGARNT